MRELKKLINQDKKNYKEKAILKNIFFYITKNYKIDIMKYIILCRKCEYYKNKRKNIFCIIKYIYYLNKKNRLGRISNLDIQTGKFGKNFTIYHKNIIINPNTIIGDNCKLHGNNCIGNDGKSEKSPIIGNNVDIGVGAIIIGDITIGDNIIIGANSLVNKSFKEEGITIAGVPARRIK